VLIYNSIIEGSVGSRKALAKKSSLLKKFSAMKTGEVYSLGPDFFQNSTKLVDVMEDIYHILNGENNSLSVLTKKK
jgi:iron complex transport system substrate-binding protein